MRKQGERGLGKKVSPVRNYRRAGLHQQPRSCAICRYHADVEPTSENRYLVKRCRRNGGHKLYLGDSLAGDDHYLWRCDGFKFIKEKRTVEVIQKSMHSIKTKRKAEQEVIVVLVERKVINHFYLRYGNGDARVLAERLALNLGRKAVVFYHGHELRWIRDAYGSQSLDSEHLPSWARVKRR